MFCPNCGSQNPDNAVSCATCGAQFAPAQPAQPVYQQPAQPTYQQPVQQPVYQQPGYPQQPVYAAKPSVPGKGLGIASMVVGIVSLALFCTGWVAIICAIVGVALGGIGLYKAKQAGMKNGMAVAGLVCSVIALAILLAYIIFFASLFAGASSLAYYA